jgi:acetyl-CoA carboxylase biotin carboxyl carrier protein
MAKLDLELVRHALTVARQHGFAEVELGVGEETFSAKLTPGRPAATKPQAVATGEPEEPKEQLQEVKATLVGYYRPAKTPLEVGITVKKGDVVAVIAALGIANDIESPGEGEVVEVLVEPNQPVQYGQVLARIRA